MDPGIPVNHVCQYGILQIWSLGAPAAMTSEGWCSSRGQAGP